jgi:hypothetical protein
MSVLGLHLQSILTVIKVNHDCLFQSRHGATKKCHADVYAFVALWITHDLLSGHRSASGKRRSIAKTAQTSTRHPSESWDPVPLQGTEGAGFQLSLE